MTPWTNQSDFNRFPRSPCFAFFLRYKICLISEDRVPCFTFHNVLHIAFMFCFTQTCISRFVLVKPALMFELHWPQVHNSLPTLLLCLVSIQMHSTFPHHLYLHSFLLTCTIFLNLSSAMAACFSNRFSSETREGNDIQGNSKICKSCKPFPGYKNILRAKQNLIEEIYFFY